MFTEQARRVRDTALVHGGTRDRQVADHLVHHLAGRVVLDESAELALLLRRGACFR